MKNDIFGYQIFSRAGFWALAALLLCWFRFSDFFAFGESRYIEPYGDGFKNYAVLQYHVAHDSSYAHFGGMNYPFGEHIVSADGQPLLANSLLWLRKKGWLKRDVVPEVIHLTLLSSVVLAVITLFLLMRALGVPPIVGGVAALGMVFLSPQMARMGAHYGLGQVAALPVLFWLLYRFRQQAGFLKSLAIAAVLIAFSLLHFYFFALLGAVILLWHFFDALLREKGSFRPLRKIWDLLIQMGLPALFFYIWLFRPDTISDRSEQPWGFFHYKSNFSGLLTSLSQPHFRWLNEQVLSLRVPDLEAANYLGLAAIGGLIFLGAGSGLSPKKRFAAKLSGKDRFVVTLLAVSVILLLFSFGLPFALPGLKNALSYFGPIQQFRSIGRFSWPFYFAVNIGVIYGFCRYRQKMIPLLLLVLSGEAFFFQRSLDLRLDEVHGLEEGRKLTELSGITIADYQAILTLPYYNVGSDNFWWSPEGFILQKSLFLGVTTGLPTTSTLASRASIGQAWEQLQLVSTPYRDPLILEKFEDERPLLVLWDDQQIQQAPQKYAHFLPDLVPLYEESRLRIFSLDLASFRRRVQEERERVLAETRKLKAKFPDRLLMNDEGKENFILETYEGTGESEGYLDGSGKRETFANHFPFFEANLSFARKGVPQKIALWAKLNQDLAARVKVRLVEKTSKGDKVLQTREYTMGPQTVVFDSNGWGLVEFEFTPETDASRLELSFFHDERGKVDFFWDEVFVRPANEHYYRLTDAFCWKDNRWFPR